MTTTYLQDIPQSRFTDETIKEMYNLVDMAKVDEKFQRLIYGVVNREMRGKWKQYRQEIETLLQWVKQVVDYRRDPYNVELVQDVWASLDRRRGDCDDMALLVAAGAEVLGAPSRFVTVSTRPNGQPSHVYLEVMVDGVWSPVDPIVQESFVGWEPTDGITAKKVWTRKSLGLAGYDPGEPIEGLGMNDQSMPAGWVYDEYNVTSRPGGAPRWEGGFADRMHSVNLTPYPDDISATFAPGVPGSEIIMRRIIPGALIAPTADGVQMDKPGGGVYSKQYPIMDRENPEKIFQTVPYQDVPMVLDPNVWTGSVPDAVIDPNAMLPQKAVTEEGMMTDLAGLGFDVGRMDRPQRQELHRQYRECKRAAQQAVRDACREMKEKYRGDMAACRAAKQAGRMEGVGDTYLTYREMEPQAPIMGEYMNTLMGVGNTYDENFYADYTLVGVGGMDGVGGLMSDVTKIVGAITETVTAGAIKQEQVGAAVNYAVDWYAEKRGLTPGTKTPQPPAYAPKPSLPPVAKAGIGTGVLVAGAVVLFLVVSKKKRRRR